MTGRFRITRVFEGIAKALLVKLNLSLEESPFLCQLFLNQMLSQRPVAQHLPSVRAPSHQKRSKRTRICRTTFCAQALGKPRFRGFWRIWLLIIIKRQDCHNVVVGFSSFLGAAQTGCLRGMKRGPSMGARDWAAKGWCHHHKLCELWFIDGRPRLSRGWWQRLFVES